VGAGRKSARKPRTKKMKNKQMKRKCKCKMSFVFILSVILGGVSFILALVFSILQLTGTIVFDLYYNLLALAISNSIGLYFVIVYIILYTRYHDQINIERINKEQRLYETNIRPSENYSIKIM
jgi:hypothetical protein